MLLAAGVGLAATFNGVYLSGCGGGSGGCTDPDSGRPVDVRRCADQADAGDAGPDADAAAPDASIGDADADGSADTDGSADDASILDASVSDSSVDASRDAADQ